MKRKKKIWSHSKSVPLFEKKFHINQLVNSKYSFFWLVRSIYLGIVNEYHWRILTIGSNRKHRKQKCEFFSFTQWVLILRLWYYWYPLVCDSISLESPQSEITLPADFLVKFLGYYILFFIYFCWLFMLSWEMDIIYWEIF